jgi:hypothetical protein
MDKVYRPTPPRRKLREISRARLVREVVRRFALFVWLMGCSAATVPSAPPESKSVEQYFGVSWWTYRDIRVLVVSGEVKKIAKR